MNDPPGRIVAGFGDLHFSQEALMDGAIAVVGGSGFIGQRVVSVLGVQGRFAVQLDRTHGTDIRDPISLSTVPTDQVAVALVLAQSPDYRLGLAGHRDLVATNIMGIVNVLEWATQSGLQHVVLVSSASVYRASERCISPETDIPSPETVYGASKLAAEAVARSYAEKLDVTIVRPFLVYGPGQTAGLLPRTLAAIRGGQPILLEAGMGPLLSPLYVEDLANLLVTLALRKPASSFQIIDVPGPEQVHLVDIVEIAARHWEVTPHLIATSGIAKGHAALWAPPEAARRLLEQCVPSTRVSVGLNLVFSAMNGKEDALDLGT